MNRRLRSIVAGVLAGTACALAAPGAHGDGLPVPFDGGDNAGVAVPESAYRYRRSAPDAIPRSSRPRSEPARSSAPPRLEGDWGVPRSPTTAARAGSRLMAGRWS